VNRLFIGDDDSGNIPSRRNDGRFRTAPIGSRGYPEAERGYLEPKFQTQRWKNGRDTTTSGKFAINGAFERRHNQKFPVNHHRRLQTTAIGSRGYRETENSEMGKNFQPEINQNNQDPLIRDSSRPWPSV
jgi:hypothetical protein